MPAEQRALTSGALSKMARSCMERPSIPNFPACHRCESSVKLLTTMRPLEDGSEVYLVECTKCRLSDMYVMKGGALSRV